jgi:ABC-type branched-subunit amino acid transport system permease subunit
MDLIAFATGLISLALIYGLLAVGLNLQFGFAGVINFGYVAFFAVGAFASALVTLPPPGSEAYLAASARYEIALGWPVWSGFLAAGLAGGLLALFIGAVSARLATHYLAVATFAMAEVVRSVLGNETWLTRGEFGISNVPQPLGSWACSSPRSAILARRRSGGCCARSRTTRPLPERWASGPRGRNCARSPSAGRWPASRGRSGPIRWA